MKKSIEIKENTLELWDCFSKTADFKSNEYDKQLLVDIKKELGFNEKSDIRVELISKKTTPEKLLSTLLKLMKPFSFMLNDLLKMFEAAGAQYSDKNIQIQFDFEEAESKFGLDLKHFREYRETVAKVVNHELYLELSDPWKDFVRPLESLYFLKALLPIPFEIEHWLEEYRNRESNWPEYFPPSPKSGIERIDNLFAEIWQIPKVACDIYRKCYQADLGRWRSLREKRNDNESQFYIAESDFWIGSFVKIAYMISGEIKGLEKQCEDPILMVNNIAEKLQAFRDRMPFFSVKNERVVKEFLDLLTLPVWEKRHALYSAWVSTQILSAFEKERVKFNVVDGILSYSFSGSTIASINYDHMVLKLIAELRTPYEGVKGHGRKHNIQPDYSLCLNNELDPMNTVLVVECKQYKKPNKKNFTEAIEDYAGGRPVAQIILANYTSIPESFRAKLPPEVSKRVPFFDALTPGDISCDFFKKAVSESLPKKKYVSLYWMDSPLDLDLMLKISEYNGKTTDVNYNNRGCLDKYPFAYLYDDVTKGNGHEVIGTLVFPALKYEYCVHNYSGERTKGSLLVVAMYSNRIIMVSYNADLEKTKMWHALTIDNSEVFIVDEIVPFTNTEDKEIL